MSSLSARVAVSDFNANFSNVPYIIADSAADLLSYLTFLNAMAAAGSIASVTLTGANTVSASQATTLAQLPGFSLDAGATLVVADTGPHLTSISFLAGINLATSLVLTGDSSVNVATLSTLSQLANLTEAPKAVLHVIDSAANLLTLTNANGLSLATYTLITGANTVTAAQATTLAGMTRFGGVAGSSLTVSDSAANVLGNVTSVGRYASNTILTGQNTISAADLVTLTAVYHMSLGAAATLVVNDTFADRSSALATIAGMTARIGYGAPAGVQFVLSSTPATSAAALQADPATISFSIADTGADLNGSALVALQADDKLTGITITDANPLSMSYSQYVGLGNAISLITGNFSLSLTDVPVSAASSVQSDAHVSAFFVTDSAANVFANTAALLADTKLNQVGGIDPTITVPYAASAVALYGHFTLDSLILNGVPVAAVGAISQLASVAEFTITDTAAQFAGQTATFAFLPQVSGITVTGTAGGDTIDLTGVVSPVTSIDLGRDAASVSAGLSAPALNFIGSPDAVILGSGPSTISYTLRPVRGIETISHFTYGLDTLTIDLKGTNASLVHAFDTTVNGAHAISIASSADPTHGVVLLGVAASQTALDLMSNHSNVANGHLTIT
jgi:hypothetical protein